MVSLGCSNAWEHPLIVGEAPGVIAVEAVINVKTVLLAITPIFIVMCLFFGTRNGFYDTDKYHGNGSAH
ncbi:hypothetical protein [Synechococcus sp. PCC 6312]|uniref:hypothetical protein n=1 Tax=Synechococcus sp. (strain ATCC 27167 / PCC 6312) TaxID=195253 RepID=UPI0002DA3E60|nr:hypothetical protein [Synechococcus sp. PCC 6312]